MVVPVEVREAQLRPARPRQLRQEFRPHLLRAQSPQRHAQLPATQGQEVPVAPDQAGDTLGREGRGHIG